MRIMGLHPMLCSQAAQEHDTSWSSWSSGQFAIVCEDAHAPLVHVWSKQFSAVALQVRTNAFTFSSLACGPLKPSLPGPLAAESCTAMPHEARLPVADGSALIWTDAQGLEDFSC